MTTIQSIVGEPEAFVEKQQLWSRFPIIYNPKSGIVSWSHQKLSDIYRTLYTVRDQKMYIQMVQQIKLILLDSLKLSSELLSYTLMDSTDGFLQVRSHEEPVYKTTRAPKEYVRPAPILPVYKDGLYKYRTDICTAYQDVICIRWIPSSTEAPPQYKVYWHWKNLSKKRDPLLYCQIHTPKLLTSIRESLDSGYWNLVEVKNAPTLLWDKEHYICILEQY
jgi:hypothetical protein